VIELRVYEPNKPPLIISTKQTIKPGEWNEQTQRVNARNQDADDINFYLDKYLQDLKNLRIERKFKNLPFTFDDIKGFFKKKNEKTSSYIEFVKQELAMNKEYDKKTKTQHENTLNKLTDFHKKDVLFTDLTPEFIDRFLNHLREKGFKTNYVNNFHKNIKKYFELAIVKEYTDLKNPCKIIRVKNELTKFDALTTEQMEAIRNLALEDHEERLKHVRDMFLFACYTALRISDTTGLKTSSISIIEQGYKLNFRSKKSKKPVNLPLYKLFPGQDKISFPEKIVLQYLNAENEYLFPRIPEQKINEHLKILAHKAKIKFNLTFHVARHTFGTVMSSKVSPFELMDLMQISDLKTVMVYVNINETKIVKSLENIDWNN
jgi:site-specific recombinase XerD